MGLNESFAGGRSHLLLWSPLLSLNQDYNLFIREESQRVVTGTISVNVALKETSKTVLYSVIYALTKTNLNIISVSVRVVIRPQ